MTKRRARPWPSVANRARETAIFEAAEIQIAVGEIHKAIKARNLDLAHILLNKVGKSARIIQLELENAPAGSISGSENNAPTD